MYYTIVLIIAIILLVIALTVVGITIRSGSNKKQFPTFQNTCPDFWTSSTTNDIITCSPPPSGINTPSPEKFVGNNAPISHEGVTIDADKKVITSINLDKTKWMSICDQSKWSAMNGIMWDGVSNNNSC